MMVAENNIPVVIDKKEEVPEIKKHVRQKWNRKYQLSVKVGKNLKLGAKVVLGKNFSILNPGFKISCKHSTRKDMTNFLPRNIHKKLMNQEKCFV